MKNRRRKRTMRIIVRSTLLVLAILFYIWIIASIFNVNANNLSGGNVWDWNAFKVIFMDIPRYFGF